MSATWTADRLGFSGLRHCSSGAARSAQTGPAHSLLHGDVLVWGGPSRLIFHGACAARRVHPLTGALRYNSRFARRVAGCAPARSTNSMSVRPIDRIAHSDAIPRGSGSCRVTGTNNRARRTQRS